MSFFLHLRDCELRIFLVMLVNVILVIFGIYQNLFQRRCHPTGVKLAQQPQKKTVVHTAKYLPAFLSVATMNVTFMWFMCLST